MAVDLDSLSMSEFLELLAYKGNPPPDPEFDNIRMTPQEWEAAFPAAKPTEEVPADAAVPEAAPAPD